VVKISVITPTKDRPEAVDLCRRWFREQTYPVHEHLIVETGGGQLENFSEGMKQATGDVILFADDDDYYGPRWVQRVAAAYRNPKVQAAGQVIMGLYHIRAAKRWEGKRGPLPGTISFRRENIDAMESRMAYDKRPKRIVQDVHSEIIREQHCIRIMGLYPHIEGQGRGMSRRHNPAKFPIQDPGRDYLTRQIGPEAVAAYLDACQKIDDRLGVFEWPA